MRRLDRLARIGLCVLTICVAAPALARGASSPAPDPQLQSSVKKSGKGTPARQWESHLRQLDTNRDGRVTFAEWDADEDSFNVHDWDHDGILSGDEVLAGAVCPDIPARTLLPGAEPYDVLFERLDSNHDDNLSKREFHGTATAFSQLDFNRDGTISPFEFGVGRR
jgi:Ca2+-binding EF-hand superfamily protein